ncbi:DUF1345 domain-containing protein [Sphingomonas sp. HDW15A]|uniref:DUF1345 domain-containing protein n=1 Tax=Sphingomonas sp. HDW15A TaxID=2714942 RepID=UPI001407CB2A|nr:DUF1345 domain-containing protein [Sphingomonas sp. HDW15A]QIK95887.1 DUF1345 domain-containing protein [Sphingomonas sp. HDW15A]
MTNPRETNTDGVRPERRVERHMPRPANVRHGRYILFVSIFAFATLGFRMAVPWDYAIAVGFDVASLIFILSAAVNWRAGRPGAMRDQALRDDVGRSALLLLTVAILCLVLGCIGSLLERRTHLGPTEIGIVVVTLVMAFLFANLVYAFHYARMYYDQCADGADRGGLAFPSGSDPSFADFVNFAFVLGMTYQTADVGITRSDIRRVSTVHGLVAFFFNIGVLALTVNVVASAL